MTFVWGHLYSVVDMSYLPVAEKRKKKHDIDGVDIGIVVQASQGRLRFLDDRAGIQGLALADGPS